jgi:hypothetical protein
MGKHEIGYARVERDFYPTPHWVVTHGLLPFVSVAGLSIWECAAGEGGMAEPLCTAGAKVFCSDIEDRGYPLDMRLDFTKPLLHPPQRFQGIITNPPFGDHAKLAEAFVETGLERIKRHDGFLALLLPTDFDCGKTRRQWFKDCPLFAIRIILTKRIKWFDHEGDRAPKENHCWYVWDSRWKGPPIILYGPSDQFYQDEKIETAAQHPRQQAIPEVLPGGTAHAR